MLVLKIFLKLIPYAIYKSFRIIIIFVKKSLQFILENKLVWPYFKYMQTFILCFANINVVSKKKNCKQNAVSTYSFVLIKMVFVLLIKQVVIQI